MSVSGVAMILSGVEFDRLQATLSEFAREVVAGWRQALEAGGSDIEQECLTALGPEFEASWQPWLAHRVSPEVLEASRPLIEAVRAEAHRTAELFYYLSWEVEDVPEETLVEAWEAMERLPERVPDILRQAREGTTR